MRARVSPLAARHERECRRVGCGPFRRRSSGRAASGQRHRTEGAAARPAGRGTPCSAAARGRQMRPVPPQAAAEAARRRRDRSAFPPSGERASRPRDPSAREPARSGAARAAEQAAPTRCPARKWPPRTAEIAELFSADAWSNASEVIRYLREVMAGKGLTSYSPATSTMPTPQSRHARVAITCHAHSDRGERALPRSTSVRTSRYLRSSACCRLCIDMDV